MSGTARLADAPASPIYLRRLLRADTPTIGANDMHLSDPAHPARVLARLT